MPQQDVQTFSFSFAKFKFNSFERPLGRTELLHSATTGRTNLFFLGKDLSKLEMENFFLEKDLSKSEMEESITELDCGITYSELVYIEI